MSSWKKTGFFLFVCFNLQVIHRSLAQSVLSRVHLYSLYDSLEQRFSFFGGGKTTTFVQAQLIYWYNTDEEHIKGGV